MWAVDDKDEHERQGCDVTRDCSMGETGWQTKRVFAQHGRDTRTRPSHIYDERERDRSASFLRGYGMRT